MTEPGGDRWALFLDFDGTLVDIADRPDAVVVDPSLPDLLRRLRRAFGGALAVVTGRSVAAIDAFLPGLGLDVCGLHGAERRVGGRIRRLEPPNPAAFRRQLAAILAGLPADPGILVEDKGESAAFHWRLAPERAGLLRHAAERLVGEVPGYRLQEGKAVVEVVPQGSGKGLAITALLAAAPYCGRLPVFAGDDVTDEHGFAAVADAGGLSIKVGPGPTRAGCRLASPASLRRYLSEVADGARAVEDLPA